MSNNNKESVDSLKNLQAITKQSERERPIDTVADLVRAMVRKNEPFINIAIAIDGYYATHLEAVKREAEEYWRTYYGMASAEQEPPYDKLTDYQKKVLADYYTKQLSNLSPIKQEEHNHG